MSIAALVHTLLTAGVDHETVVAAVRAVEQHEEAPKRSSAAERQARYRARKASQSVTSDVTEHNVTSQRDEKSSPERPSTSLSEPLSSNQNLSTPPIGPPPRKARSDAADGVSTLRTAGVPSAVLADWQAVRKAKKAGPITETVAMSVIREAGKAGMTPAAAVQMAAERSWQGFKSDWAIAEARAGPSSQSRAPRTNYFADEALRLENERLGRTQGFGSSDGGGIIIEAEASDRW